MNRLEEADSVMRRTIGINGNNPALWVNYGTVLARKGDFQHAKQAVATALALKPDFEEAQQLMRTLVEASR